MRPSIIAFALAAILSCTALAADAASASYGPELEGFDYPHPVKYFAFASQGEAMRMAYMDVAPAKPNGRTVVLLHGKNFCAATWESAIFPQPTMATLSTLHSAAAAREEGVQGVTR